MQIDTANSLLISGAINSATIKKHETDPKYWVIEVALAKPSPYLNLIIETARGEDKKYKTIEAARNDLVKIGFKDAIIELLDPDPMIDF